MSFLLQLLKSMTTTRKIFHVTGMHCMSCVQRIQSAVISIDPSANVKLYPPSIETQSDVTLEEIQESLYSLPEYQIIEGAPGFFFNNFFRTFWPLISIFLVLIIFCALGQWNQGSWDANLAMTQFMAGFFIIFSLFKFINLRGFVDSYRSYDLLAQHWPFYGWAYPFIELSLGIAYALETPFIALDVFTLVLMLFSALGVYKALKAKRKIPCACLGTLIKLPMTWITLAEDLLMAFMAFLMILNH